METGRHLLHAGHHDDADGGVGGLEGESEETWITSMGPMRLHGICMILGWLFFLNVGSMVARYLKKAAQPFPSWFPIHVWMQAFGALLTILGFGLIVAHISYEGGLHFTSLHHVVGLLIFLLVIIQVYLGSAAHFAWFEGKQTSPIDMWHWWLGRLALVAAMFECLLGLQVFVDEGLKVGANVWGAVGLLVLVSFFSLSCYEVYCRPHASHFRSWKSPESGDELKAEAVVNEFRFVLFYGLLCAVLSCVAAFGIAFNVHM